MDTIRKQFSEYYMYITVVIWFSSEVILNTTLEKVFYWKSDDVNDFIARLCLVLLSIQIFVLQKYKPWEIIVIGVISIPIIIGTINSNHNMMVATWMFIVASKYVDFEKVSKVIYIVLIVTIPLVLYLNYIGVIDDRVIYRGNIIRHSLGFAHPNWLGVRIFQLVLLHCYLRRSKLGVFDYLIIIAGAIFVKKVPNCQTAYIALLVFLTMLLIYRVVDLVNQGKEKYIKYTIVMAACANFFSVILSTIDVRKNVYLNFIDNLMSRRFLWCYKTYKYYGWSLFGQNIEIWWRKMGVMYPRFYLDNAYMSILLRYGVFVYVIFTSIYLYTMVRCLRMKNYILVIILAMYSIYGIMENSFFSMTQNIFLIAIASSLYSLKLEEPQEVSDSKRIRYKITV